MKKYSGFNLIELMIAIAISASILTAIINSFSSLYSGFMFNNNRVEQQQSLRFAMSVIRHDLENAGVFGSFSFHNQVASSQNYENRNIFGSCTGDWCEYQLTGIGVGVRSYLAGSNISGSGINATSGDILRIQLGGDKFAYFNSALSSPSQISNINFSVASTDTTSARTYMLAASNHAYLINLGAATPNTSLSNLGINIRSAENGIFYDPDQATLTLVPFITKYYFVNSAGLQVVSYDGNQLTGPTLVSDRINLLTINYKVDNIPSANLNHVGSNNSYVWCSTAAMNNNANSLCFNRWSQITAVNIILGGVSRQNVGSGNVPLTQIESETVGWLW